MGTSLRCCCTRLWVSWNTLVAKAHWSPMEELTRRCCARVRPTTRTRVKGTAAGRWSAPLVASITSRALCRGALAAQRASRQWAHTWAISPTRSTLRWQTVRKAFALWINQWLSLSHKHSQILTHPLSVLANGGWYTGAQFIAIKSNTSITSATTSSSDSSNGPVQSSSTTTDAVSPTGVALNSSFSNAIRAPICYTIGFPVTTNGTKSTSYLSFGSISVSITFTINATIICTNAPNAGHSISHQRKFNEFLVD